MTTIVHTTDVTNQNDGSFEHSVALARAGRARLVTLVANAAETSIENLPDAGDVLSGWGASADLVEHDKQVHRCCDDPVETVLDALRTLQPDLVVAATHQRSALARFLSGSRAEAIAHNVTAPILLLRPDTHGFVSSRDGTIRLPRVLVPFGDPEAAQVALRTATWFLDLCGVDRTELTLLHIGVPVQIDATAFVTPGRTLRHVEIAEGEIDATIAEHTEQAGLVVMATRGHDSVGDVFRGSHTDRVLHKTQCPLLSIRL